MPRVLCVDAHSLTYIVISVQQLPSIFVWARKDYMDNGRIILEHWKTWGSLVIMFIEYFSLSVQIPNHLGVVPNPD